jgi:pimeloyl-ACP methyl ester carboxylesterase
VSVAQGGYAALNDGRLYYEVVGAGPPLALVHGFTLDRRMWQDQLPALAAGHRVITMDLRGFGLSDPPAGPYSSVADLKALLDYLDAGPAAIMGLSMGGGVATSFALTYPDATSALILADSNLWGYPFSPEFAQSFGAVTTLARAQGVAAARERWLADALFAPALEQPAVAAALRALVNDYSGWHWLHRDPERGMEPQPITALQTIRAPTLVVGGERDVPDFRRISAILAESIPWARYVILLGVGHMSNMEAPTAFNTTVGDFLAML